MVGSDNMLCVHHNKLHLIYIHVLIGMYVMAGAMHCANVISDREQLGKFIENWSISQTILHATSKWNAEIILSIKSSYL